MVFPYTDVLEKTDDGFPFLPEAGNHKVKLKRVFVCVWVLKESYNSVFHTDQWCPFRFKEEYTELSNFSVGRKIKTFDLKKAFFIKLEIIN